MEYKYIVIDKIRNIEEEFKDCLSYKKDLNTWIVYYKERNLVFEQKLEKYIIGINDLTLEKMIINNLMLLNHKIATAESCTGGLIISRLIGVSGASNVINESYVTYANESKVKILNVKENTISKYGVQSVEVAEEMVNGLLKITGADICISVTGYTTSEERNDTDGIFYFGIKEKETGYVYLEKECFLGTRDEIRYQQATYILWCVNNLLSKKRNEMIVKKYK